MAKIRRRFSFWDVENPQSVVMPRTGIRKAVYMGVTISEEDNVLKWASTCYDGSEFLGFHEDVMDVGDIMDTQSRWASVANKIVHTLSQYTGSHNYRIQAVGIGYDQALRQAHKEEVDRLQFHPLEFAATRFWFEMDVIPFIIEVSGSSLEEQAASAVRKVVDWIKPQFPMNIPRIKVSPDVNEVCVDLDNHCRMVQLESYRATTDPKVWEKLIEFANECKERKLRFGYFNSTPQGGGVALMRHSMIRLMRLLGVDCHWYVAKPNPEVFVITKRKFHNVLQGVAPDIPENHLTEQDMDLWLEWCKSNFDRYWGHKGGVVERTDVIIIDDPQVTGIIPEIKRVNPRCRIIYRSHIEIRSDLVAIEGSMQNKVWNFLYQFIGLADMFISHPVAGFVPPYVKRSRVVLMPAATDQLDGLNKPLSDADIQYYRAVFNRFCEDQCTPQLRRNSNYFIQVSRFDPSKGIPDAIKAYLLFKQRCLKENMAEETIPQMVVCGVGSIDDPDGNVVYNAAVAQVCSPGYGIVRNDTCIARLPHCDQALNSLMRGATAALQLSYREGFEVKVTEALMKHVPVIAYRSGGIPLQLDHEVTGYLVERGNVEEVAKHMYDIYMDDALHQRLISNMRKRSQMEKRQEYYTPFQSVNWLYLVTRLAYKGKGSSDLAVGKEKPEEGTYLGDGSIMDWNIKYIKDFWRDQQGV